MRGTQLLQLHEDYETILESIETTKAIIDRKKVFLPELKKEANIAKETYEEMLSARDIEADIEKAQNELVWRQIALKEEETEKKRKELQQYEEVMRQLEERRTQAEVSKKGDGYHMGHNVSFVGDVIEQGKATRGRIARSTKSCRRIPGYGCPAFRRSPKT